jgi:hypothetical protein
MGVTGFDGNVYVRQQAERSALSLIKAEQPISANEFALAAPALN